MTDIPRGRRPGRSRTIDDLPFLSVVSAEYTADPQPRLRRLTSEGHDLARTERGVEVLSYAACEALVKDTALSPGLDLMVEACGIDDQDIVRLYAENMQTVSGRAHARLRQAVAPYFSDSYLESHRRYVRELVDRLIDEGSRGGEIEFVGSVAGQIGSHFFTRLLDVDEEHWPTIARLSDANVKIFYMDESLREEIVTSFAETRELLDKFMADKRQNPGDDMLSGLLRAEARGDLTDDEIFGLIFILLVGSTDTTQSQLCLMVDALGRNPDQLERLRADPESLARSTILESARWRPGVWTVPRFAASAGRLADLEYEAGTILFANVASANRDPEVFEDPDRFDVTRQSASPPFNWSRGEHFCIGRPLALLEMEEALKSLLSRWDGWELAGPLETHGQPDALSIDRMPLRVSTSSAD
ncbi:cytochrome P450 [Streptomyces sp. NPDC001663]|uniref:cytochrome P450 n=1 Tax=Streptomyces sp. NPDC001663 TaxID=3364597 RepID=UPI0036CAA957